MLKHLKQSFSLDFRSLGLLRILIGVIVLVDLLGRFTDWHIFYSNEGILSNSYWKQEMSSWYHFSFFAIFDFYFWPVIVFFIHALIAGFYLVGFHTKVMSVLLWVFTCSMQDHNWLINSGGDDVLRVMLFVTLFLPLGAYFSVDRARCQNPVQEKSLTNLWTFVYLFQLTAVYYFTGILKESGIWLKDFSAIYYALKIKVYRGAGAPFLEMFPWGLRIATLWTIVLEIAGPFLLIVNAFFFKFKDQIKVFLITNFILLHLGIVFAFSIGTFPWICLIFWIGLLPTSVWSFLENKLIKPHHQNLKIYYDEDCGFCLKGVRILKAFFLHSSAEIYTAQSDPITLQEMQEHHSWVVVDPLGIHHFRFDAVHALSLASPVLRPLAWVLKLPLVFKLGTKFYIWISHNRRLMGKVTRHIKYTEEPAKSYYWLTGWFAPFVLLSIFYWNVKHTNKVFLSVNWIERPSQLLHLYQNWNMFAPHPRLENIWFHVQVKDINNKSFEYISGRPVYTNYDSDGFYRNLKNKQWRKFYTVMAESPQYVPYYASYLCRNNPHIVSMDVILHTQPNLTHNMVDSARSSHLWTQHCRAIPQ